MKLQLKLFIISLIFQIPMGLYMVYIHVGDSAIFDITPLFPIEDKQIDLIYLLVLTPFISLVFILLFSTILTRIFLNLHSVIKRNRYEYILLTEIEKRLSFKELISRAIILGLFIYSIGTAFYNIVNPTFIYSPYSPSYGHPLMLIAIASLFLLPFLILLILPIWLLLDSGIVRYQKKLRVNRQELPDIEGVYNWYYSIIKGYAGIGTIVSIITLLFDVFRGEGGADPITTVGSPFLIIGAAVIPVILYNWRLQRSRDNLIKQLTKKGMKIVEDLNSIDFSIYKKGKENEIVSNK